MYIGLTGRNASGKGEVARYLGARGFEYHSLSDVIREEIRARGEEPTRERLVETGNELREKLGAGVLAHRVIRRLESDVHAVIDSIRNPAEVETLRSTGQFRLVRVDADPRTRFDRIRERRREGDPEDFEAFQALEDREAEGRAHSQNLLAVGEMADCAITNGGTLDELRAGVDALLLRLLKEFPRPGWDQYFMDIARVAASRSNCLKRKVAAIIVREKRIISTGYNGTPRGTKNCNEGGCPRCNSLASSGTQLDECLCSHGEENAIVQAAYHGVGLSGSTIYSTYAPCLMCAKMIINSGIAEVVYNRDYPLNDSAFRLFREAGVEVRRLPVAGTYSLGA
jgi:dCMP deaminase